MVLYLYVNYNMFNRVCVQVLLLHFLTVSFIFVVLHVFGPVLDEDQGDEEQLFGGGPRPSQLRVGWHMKVWLSEWGETDEQEAETRTTRTLWRHAERSSGGCPRVGLRRRRSRRREDGLKGKGNGCRNTWFYSESSDITYLNMCMWLRVRSHLQPG